MSIPAHVQGFSQVSVHCCNFPCAELNGHWLYDRLPLHPQPGLEDGGNLLPRVGGKVQEAGPTGHVGLEPREDTVREV